MTRFGLLCALALLAGCGGSSPPSAPPLPARVDPGWTLESLQAIDVALAPDFVREAGLRAAWRASYAGPGLCEVTVFELSTSAAAFELVQKWRPQEGRVSTYSGTLFLVVESKQVGQAELIGFAGGLERRLRSTL
jgi:hypothetical protein